LERLPASAETTAVLGHLMARQGFYFTILGSARKGKARSQEALALLEGVGNTEDFLAAYHSHCLASVYQGEYADLALAAQQGLAIAKQLDDAWWTAWFLYWLGGAARFQGNYVEAKRLGIAALSLTEADGELWMSACNTGFLLANATLALCEYADAKRYSEQCFRLFQEFDHPWGIAMAYGFLGSVAVATHDFAAAHNCYQQRLRLFAESGR